MRAGSLLSLLALAVPPAAPQEPNAKEFRVEIAVELPSPVEGALPIRMTFRDPPPGSLGMRWLGDEPEHRFGDLQVEDLRGQPLEHQRRGRRVEILEVPTDGFTVRYLAEPGGEGRHGHQGWVGADFALFDGRVLMLPQTAEPLARAELRYRIPAGWVAATPFTAEEDGFVVEGPGMVETLLNSCVGLGPFEATTRELGTTQLEVWSYGPWSPAHKSELAEGSLRLAEHFHGQLGFDPGGRFVVVWTPKASDGGKVFGGTWSNGTCYEHPTTNERSWQLLAHRMGHALNKYHPTGMIFRDGRDRWFQEGWASYIEVAATHAVGLGDDQRRFDHLYERYQRTLREHPERDLPLAREPEATGETKEFLHYVKGPLVVRSLDHWMDERCGRDMTSFAAHIHATYGGFREPLPLREELEAHCGASLDDFFELMVDQPGAVVPVWRSAEDAGESDGPAGRAGAEPIPGDYLFHLAASSDFERYHQVVEFVEQELALRQRLELRHDRPWLTWLRRDVEQRPPEWRYALARLERAQGAERAVPAGSSGCRGGGGSSEPVRFEPDLDSIDGALFARLLELETAYDSARGAGGASGLELRVGSSEQALEARPQLALEADDRMVVFTHWHALPDQPALELLQSEQVTGSREVSVEPGWSRTWTSFGAEQRASEPGLVTVRLRSGEDTLLERGFWQR